MIETIIIQNIASTEIRTIQLAGMLTNDSINIVRCSLSNMENHSIALQSGKAMAVGSVEFVRKSFNIGNIIEPINLSYHNRSIPYLGRTVKMVTLSDLKLIAGSIFVKPVTTKLFTGLVVDFSQLDTFDEHDSEQFSILNTLSLDTELWVSDVIEFVCEWRYYIHNSKIIGKARYDPDGLDDAAVPSDLVIIDIISSLNIKHPYALDIGVLTNGDTVIVELNDAWAIGLYSKALTPIEYLAFLSDRWSTLVDVAK